MKLIRIIVLLGAVIATTYAECWKTNAPNQQNCATANVDGGTVLTGQCGSEGGWTPMPGICTEDVLYVGIISTQTGKGKIDNVTCTCACTGYCGPNTYPGKTCRLDKTYSKLNTVNCPS